MLVYIAETEEAIYRCPETKRGRRCGKCMRGVFQAYQGSVPGRCRVCGAEHWVGNVKCYKPIAYGYPFVKQEYEVEL